MAIPFKSGEVVKNNVDFRKLGFGISKIYIFFLFFFFSFNWHVNIKQFYNFWREAWTKKGTISHIKEQKEHNMDGKLSIRKKGHQSCSVHKPYLRNYQTHRKELWMKSNMQYLFGYWEKKSISPLGLVVWFHLYSYMEHCSWEQSRSL